MNTWTPRLFLLVLLAWMGPACGSGSVLLISQVVTAAGGTVVVPGATLTGVQVDIPAGALAASTTISIHQVPSSDPDVLSFEFGPDGTVFALPVTVTIKYLDQYLTNNSIVDTDTLHVVGTNPNVAPETFKTSAKDDVANTISAQTTHFTGFSVLGYSMATLSGDYTMMAYTYETSATQLNAAAMGNPQPVPKGFSDVYGTMHFDGAGGVSFSGTKRIDTSSAAPNSGSGTYFVAADGTFSMNAGSSFTGSVLAGGSMLIFSSNNNQPQMSVAVKRVSGTFSTASLTGNYGTEYYMYETSITQPLTPAPGPAIAPLGFTSTVGTLTFDGAGNVSFAGTKNTDGTSAVSGGAGTYSVDSAGTVSITAGATFTGALLAGGNVLIWASTSNQPQLSISVKKGGTFNLASLNGTYGTVMYRFEGATTQPATQTAGQPAIHPNGFTSTVGTLVFDGAGNVTLSGTVNTDGSGSPTNGVGTYLVATDGTYSMSAGSAFSGLVLEGGSVLIWCSTSGGPQIGVSLLRK